jgi:phosphate-selective porin OprO/OprP
VGRTVRFGAVIGLCTALLLGPAGAQGQTNDSVESLKKTVEDLTKLLGEATQRLDALEKKQAEQAAAPAPAPAPAAPARPKGALDMYWKEGLRIDSAENVNGVKPFQLKISGRLQLDASWMTEDDDLETVAESEDGVEFRRARIAIGGIIYQDFDFNAEYDFAEGEPAFKDVYMSANNIPVVGTLRVGHFKEFGSLEELVSDNDTLFIERALPNAFAPSRNVGIGLTNAFLDKRMTASIGAFRETDDFGAGGGDDNWAVTGRVTGLPYYHAVKNERVDKLQLVHLGAWATYRETDLSESDLSYRRVRPENHLAPRYINTFGMIGDVDSQVRFGAEAAMIYGPFTAQAEYILNTADRETGDDVTFQGAYLQAGYILTGEHRLYKNQQGILDKVIPKKNFQISGDMGGPGAWELVARYSWIDLDDEDVTGGSQSDLTAGVNWYLNPNLRISFNYIHGWVERDDDVLIVNDPDDPDDDDLFPAIDGDYDAFLMRFQVTW